MNMQTFSALLRGLDHAQWQAIIDGEALLMVDDLRLETGPLNSANALLKSSDHSNAESLRKESLSQAEELLDNYYRTHPLTRLGFSTQAARLIAEHGARAFAAPEGYWPERTLFVEGGVVVAEGKESPRHRYGAFCEVRLQRGEEPLMALQKWLDSGAAHERYLEMNVCRYNC